MRSECKVGNDIFEQEVDELDTTIAIQLISPYKHQHKFGTVEGLLRLQQQSRKDTYLAQHFCEVLKKLVSLVALPVVEPVDQDFVLVGLLKSLLVLSFLCFRLFRQLFQKGFGLFKFLIGFVRGPPTADFFFELVDLLLVECLRVEDTVQIE